MYACICVYIAVCTSVVAIVDVCSCTYMCMYVLLQCRRTAMLSTGVKINQSIACWYYMTGGYLTDD